MEYPFSQAAALVLALVASPARAAAEDMKPANTRGKQGVRRRRLGGRP